MVWADVSNEWFTQGLEKKNIKCVCVREREKAGIFEFEEK